MKEIELEVVETPGKINTRGWKGKTHGKAVTADQHKKGKSKKVCAGLKRTKYRWNKKKGIKEKTKKGSRETVC